MGNPGHFLTLRQRQPRRLRVRVVEAVKRYLPGILQGRVSGKTSAHDPRARYIWDRSKLAWVENPKAAVMQSPMEMTPKEDKTKMPSAVTEASDSEKTVPSRRYVWDGSKLAWVQSPKAPVAQSPKEEAHTVSEVKTTRTVENTSKPKTLVSPRKRVARYPRSDS